jgi:hypothetical protein
MRPLQCEEQQRQAAIQSQCTIGDRPSWIAVFLRQEVHGPLDESADGFVREDTAQPVDDLDKHRFASFDFGLEFSEYLLI